MKKLFSLGIGAFFVLGMIFGANCFLAESIDDDLVSLLSQHNAEALRNGEPHRVEMRRTEQFFGSHYLVTVYHESNHDSLAQCFTGEIALNHSPVDWFQLRAASADVSLQFEESTNCPPVLEGSLTQVILSLFGHQLLIGEISLGFDQLLSGTVRSAGVNFVEDHLALTIAPLNYVFSKSRDGVEQHELSWSGFEFLDHSSRASAYGRDLRYHTELSFNNNAITQSSSQLTSGDIWYSDGQRRSGLSSFNSDFSGVVSNGFMHGTGLVHADGLMLNNLPLGNFTEALRLADFPYQSFQTLALYDGQLAPTDWQSQMLETLAGTQLYIETLSLEQGSAKLNATGEIKLVTTPESPLELHLDVAINEAFIKHLADIQTITSQSFITPSSAAFETESARAQRQLEQLFEQYAEAGFLNRDGSQGYESPLSLQAGSLLLNGIPLAPAGN